MLEPLQRLRRPVQRGDGIRVELKGAAGDRIGNERPVATAPRLRASLPGGVGLPQAVDMAPEGSRCASAVVGHRTPDLSKLTYFVRLAVKLRLGKLFRLV